MKHKTISLEEAQKIVSENFSVPGNEELDLISCIGRVLAEDVISNINQPPFRRSAMDGYALRSEDLTNGMRKFRVVDKLLAGDHPEKMVHSGEAVRIMTGAPIPEGADCVIKQEETDYGEEDVTISSDMDLVNWQMNICPIGEDFFKGEILGNKGDIVDAYMVAACSACGMKKLSVQKKLNVAVIITGNELALPGDQLLPGQIYDANSAYLQARMKEIGCTVVDLQTSRDDCESIEAAVLNAAALADLIITTGGVSVGEKDVMEDVMQSVGAGILFHGIDIKPGMPTMFSVFNEIPVMSLSGNPYSSSAIFELLFQPYFNASMNGEKEAVERKYAVLENAYTKSSPVRRILRGYVHDGKVRVNAMQRNGQIKGGIGTNCFVDIPAGSGPLNAGDQVNIIRLFLWDAC